jgi:hypothetical protein
LKVITRSASLRAAAAAMARQPSASVVSGFSATTRHPASSAAVM